MSPASRSAPTRSTSVRPALVGLGVLVGLYGALLLLSGGFDNLVATAIWLGGGIVLHDAVLAPVTIAVAVLAVRVLPPVVRPWLAVVGVVVGTLTVVAVPVLGRFGAREDNPSLLPRDYVGGWLLVVVLVVVVVGVLAVVEAVRERRSRRTTDGTSISERDDRALDDRA